MGLSRHGWSAAAIFLFCVGTFSVTSAGGLSGDLNELAYGRPGPLASDNRAAKNPCANLPNPSSPKYKDRLDAFVSNLCYQKQNWPHEANRRSSEGLHAPFVKLWYSPPLFKWMTVKNRQGPIPDGSKVVKEEYLDTDPTSPILFWSVMIKDSKLWYDG